MQIGMQSFWGFEMGPTFSAKRICHLVAYPLPAYYRFTSAKSQTRAEYIVRAPKADFVEKHR